MRGVGQNSGEVWMEARRRVFRHWTPKWDSFPLGRLDHGSVHGDITSIYISEFPDSTSSKDLFGLFGCIGNVIEVSIAPRRKKGGKRFGFVRFKEVEDPRLLAISLDNIQIGGRKIHANEPRFGRRSRFGKGLDGGNVVSGDGAVRVRHKEIGYNSARGGNSVWNRNRSFADVVNNIQTGPVSNRGCLFSFSAAEVDLDRLSKAYVGKVKILGSTYGMQTKLEMEGYFNVKVTPLGDSLCLLEEYERGVIDNFVNEGEAWWINCFEKVFRWNKGIVEAEKSTWVRIYGVPAQAWKEEFFVQLANSLGKFVCLDEVTSGGECYDVARLCLILPFDSFLNESVSISIDGIVFNIAIREELANLNQEDRSTVRTESESISSDSIVKVSNTGNESEDDIEEFSSNDVFLNSRSHKDDTNIAAEMVGETVLEYVSADAGAAEFRYNATLVAAGSAGQDSNLSPAGSSAAAIVAFSNRVDGSVKVSDSSCSGGQCSPGKPRLPAVPCCFEEAGMGAGGVGGDNIIHSSSNVRCSSLEAGTFDMAVSLLKEGKKRRFKPVIFKKISDLGGSLHSRAVRKVQRGRGKEGQPRLLHTTIGRRSVSLLGPGEQSKRSKRKGKRLEKSHLLGTESKEESQNNFSSDISDIRRNNKK